MPDIGFHRTDQQWLLRRAAVAKDRSQRESFDRIADRRAGAVRFDVNDVARRRRQRFARPRGSSPPAPPWFGTVRLLECPS